MIARYRLFDQFTGNLKEARRHFKEDYGFSHDHKVKVDKEILRLFDAARMKPNAKGVTLPFNLVIAMTLREGFAREANRPPKQDWDQRRLESAIRNAWAWIPQYQELGYSKGEARTRAIREAAAADRVPESVLRDQMGRAKYRHLREMGPTHRFKP